jgi:hypothetical protein
LGAIEVYLIIGAQRSRALKLTDQTNNEWRRAVVNIGRYRSSFLVSIEGYRIFNVVGHLAVDDIDFRSKA